jgi:dolichol-phosphate mannosyltransferase
MSNAIKTPDISILVPVFNEVQALPQFLQILTRILDQLDLISEIIFINDGSTDQTLDFLRNASHIDPRIIIVDLSRNFGKESALTAGLDICSGHAAIPIDADLQDPPELIEDFVKRWRGGADVVYGRRIKREMPFFLEVCYRSFYRIFALMSEVPVPKDAGDFSLIDRSVVYWMLQCKERDSFLRGLRAYVGFRQEGVDYVRPERAFGTSTNNWIKNIGWAKKGLFSFSRLPLHLLTAAGGFASFATLILAIYSIFIRIFDPDSAPRGVTFIALLVMFFGSSMLLGIGLLGEYIGKIFEETKARPAFIRKSLISRGETRPADTHL